MSYIGNVPTTAAFPFDQFSGTGAATSFTLTYAPASATSILVAISGVMQNPNLYSVIGTTLSFSPAPPSGTNNISVLYLGLPVIGSSSPGNTAFLSATDLTATASQTVFASAGSYTPGFVQVYRNGSRLGNADYTATNGTTITLASAATAGDLVTIEYYTLTSLVNALPLTGGTVTGTVTFNSAITGAAATFSGNVTLGTSVLATPSGSAPAYLCRAWVNFNGTGTVTIRASGNVSSITDNGAGDYTVNFTTAMSDANYAPAIATQRNGVNSAVWGSVKYDSTMAASNVRIATVDVSPTPTDPIGVFVSIFR